MSSIYYFLTLIILIINFYYVYSFEIDTIFGKIRGTSMIYEKEVFHIFKKVPYAQSPTGQLRFAKPVSMTYWNDILDGTEYGPACMTNTSHARTLQKYISEDCLHLNIFTSEKCLTSSCPVLVYIHGGEINYGSAVQFNDTFLIERYVSNDIVFIAPGYRLGSFGLLAFDNDTLVPRNLAILDMIESLKFIKKIVHDFGGNSSDITVMGHSAGATSTLQMGFSKHIDPNSELFQNIISIGGTVSWTPTDIAKEATRAYIKILGCEGPNELDELNCLKSKDSFTLMKAQQDVEKDKMLFTGTQYSSPFVLEDETGFMYNPPKRNAIIGNTAKEYGSDDNHFYNDFMDFNHKTEIKKKFKQDFEEALKENRPAYSYYSNIIFVSNYICASELLKTGSNVYLYEYGLYPDLAFHASDMMYFIGTHKHDLTPEEEYVDSVYSEYLVNFTVRNEPNENWTIFDPKLTTYFNIDVNLTTSLYPKMKTLYHYDIINYWLKDLKDFDNQLTIISLNDVNIEESSNDTEQKIKISIITYILFGLIIFVGITAIIMACLRRKHSKIYDGYMELPSS